mgnify:CR=1 FL=1
MSQNDLSGVYIVVPYKNRVHLLRAVCRLHENNVSSFLK